jgi:short-subunit dehydrogenase
VLAHQLAAQDVTLLLHGRDANRGAAVVDECQRLRATAKFYSADFASLTEVAGLAEQVSKDHNRIHLLINNAGIGFGRPGSGRELSVDGHELRFAVNYLAPALLTDCLVTERPHLPQTMTYDP